MSPRWGSLGERESPSRAREMTAPPTIVGKRLVGLLCAAALVSCVAAPAPAPAGTPNPLTVKVTVDSSRAAHTAISADDGGALEATAADGARFALQVPAGAFLADQDITATPVTSIEGLPFSGGLVAAVRFDPDGLAMFKPATLTIALPRSVPSGSIFGFAYLGDGADFHLYPIVVGTGSVSLSIGHFSGYGVAQGTSADAAAQQQRVPKGAEARYDQEIASARGSGKSEQEQQKELEEIFRRWYLELVRPEVATAESNEDSIESAAYRFLTWGKALGMLGLDPARFTKENDEARRGLARAINNAIEKASKKCVDDNDALQGIRMPTWLHLGIALGLEREGFDSAGAETKIRNCLRFELEVTSEIKTDDEFHDGDSYAHYQFSLTYHATVPVETAGDVFRRWEGTGRSDVRVDDHFSDPCTATPNPKPGTPVANLTINFNLNAANNLYDIKTRPQILLMFQPGHAIENWTWDCGHGPTFDPLRGATWEPFFWTLHMDEARELDNFNSFFAIKDWTFMGGKIFATKVYDRSASGPYADCNPPCVGHNSHSERTVFDIKHVPKR